jgi:hypothetical protein
VKEEPPLASATLDTYCPECLIGIVKAFEENLCYCPYCGQLFKIEVV